MNASIALLLEISIHSSVCKEYRFTHLRAVMSLADFQLCQPGLSVRRVTAVFDNEIKS
jgi:hypothetical protein